MWIFDGRPLSRKGRGESIPASPGVIRRSAGRSVPSPDKGGLRRSFGRLNYRQRRFVPEETILDSGSGPLHPTPLTVKEIEKGLFTVEEKV
jgi:hypothetical protein